MREEGEVVFIWEKVNRYENWQFSTPIVCTCSSLHNCERGEDKKTRFQLRYGHSLPIVFQFRCLLDAITRMMSSEAEAAKESTSIRPAPASQPAFT